MPLTLPTPAAERFASLMPAAGRSLPSEPAGHVGPSFADLLRHGKAAHGIQAASPAAPEPLAGDADSAVSNPDAVTALVSVAGSAGVMDSATPGTAKPVTTLVADLTTQASARASDTAAKSRRSPKGEVGQDAEPSALIPAGLREGLAKLQASTHMPSRASTPASGGAEASVEASDTPAPNLIDDLPDAVEPGALPRAGMTDCVAAQKVPPQAATHKAAAAGAGKVASVQDKDAKAGSVTGRIAKAEEGDEPSVQHPAGLRDWVATLKLPTQAPVQNPTSTDPIQEASVPESQAQAGPTLERKDEADEGTDPIASSLAGLQEWVAAMQLPAQAPAATVDAAAQRSASDAGARSSPRALPAVGRPDAQHHQTPGAGSSHSIASSDSAHAASSALPSPSGVPNEATLVQVPAAKTASFDSARAASSALPSPSGVPNDAALEQVPAAKTASAPPLHTSDNKARSEDSGSTPVAPAEGARLAAAVLDQASFAAQVRQAAPRESHPAHDDAPSAITGAALAAPRAFTAPVGAQVVPVTLAVGLNSPEFAQVLGAQVSVLARDGVQEARVHLHPAEMGPISVQIAIDGTQARVDFSADVAATREAIERGLPELASALREQGLTLAGGGVFQQAPDRRAEDERSPTSFAAQSRRRVQAVAAPVARPVALALAQGAVDLYA